MLKKLFFVLVLSFALNQAFSQILYSERFNTLALTTASNSALQAYLYADVPTNMFAINNGNLIADTTTGNYPFYNNGQKQKAWLTYKAVGQTDTFAVSTSWLTPAGSASAYLVTPTINNIAANSVLTWEAMAPDANNADGYEIYVTATSTLAAAGAGDFTTSVFTINAEKNSWQTHGISLGVFVGKNIRIAFKNNSQDKYQLWLDDIKVENISNAFDASAVSHTNYKYSTVNVNNTISATFKNNGYVPITNLTINYKMDNGGVVSETKILSTQLEYLESKEVSFSTLYFSPTATCNRYKIWITNVNGQADQIQSNDTLSGVITVLSSAPAKKVLVEHFSSATYGWSPDGYSTLKSIANTNTNVIATSLHNNDNMSPASTAPLSWMYNTYDGTSSAMIDRYKFPSKTSPSINSTSWNTFITQRQAMVVPATVSVSVISYNASTREITAEVSTTFAGDVKGQYAINLHIKENNVYGPTNDNTDNLWNQQSNLVNIPSSPYYQLGTYLNATTNLLTPTDYKHQYVINDFLDAAVGDFTVIPTSGSTNGQTYTKTYTYTLPNVIGNEFRYNVNNIYLVGVLSEYDTLYYNGNAILNSFEQKLTIDGEDLVGLKEYAKTDIQLTVFPNPTADECHLNYTLQNNEFVKVNVYNTLGELVYIETKNVNAGNVDHILNVRDLPSGNYSVQISFKNSTVTKKLTVIK